MIFRGNVCPLRLLLPGAFYSAQLPTLRPGALAEEDLRTADLLRKATLLTHDSKIKDPDFLRQMAVNSRS